MRTWRSVAALLLTLPLLALLMARPAVAAGGGGSISLDMPVHTHALTHTVYGHAPPGSVISSPLAAQPAKADATGLYWIRLTLKEGRNTVLVRAKTVDNDYLDWVGETTVDPGAPALAADVPRSFNGQSLPIRGQAAPGSRVAVNGKWVTADAEGRFAVTLPMKTPGLRVYMSATDTAGKQTELRRWVSYSLSGDYTSSQRAYVGFKIPVGSKAALLYSATAGGSRTAIGEPVPNGEGRWGAYMPLAMGENYFWLVVAPPDGDPYFDLVSVMKPIHIVMPTQTNLAKVSLTGVVLPGASVTIGSKPATVSAKGEFSGTLTLVEGEQDLMVTVTLPGAPLPYNFGFRVKRVPNPAPLYEQQLTIAKAQPGQVFVLGEKTYTPDGNGQVTIPVPLKPGVNRVVIPFVDRFFSEGAHIYEVTYIPTTVVKLTVDQISAEVDGAPTPLPVAPRIRDGSTYLPLRFLGEVLGAKVEWDQATRTVTYTRGARVIQITVGESRALVDGREVQLAAPAVLENDRTLVPVRFISENLGAKVSWDGATRTVTVTMPKE